MDLQQFRPGPAPTFIRRLAELLGVEPSQRVTPQLMVELDRVATMIEPWPIPADLLWFWTSFPGQRIYCAINAVEHVKAWDWYLHPRRLLPIASFEGLQCVFADVCSASDAGTDVWLGSCEAADYGTFEHMWRLSEYLIAVVGNEVPSNPRLPTIDCDPKDWLIPEPNTRFVHKSMPTGSVITAEPGRYWIDAAVDATHGEMVVVDDGSGSVSLLGPPRDKFGNEVRWDDRPARAPWFGMLDAEPWPQRLSDDRTAPAAAGQRIRMLIEVRRDGVPATCRAVQRWVEPFKRYDRDSDQATEQRYLWDRRLSGATDEGPATLREFEAWKVREKQLEKEANERLTAENIAYWQAYRDSQCDENLDLTIDNTTAEGTE
jgi:hypothetical protein